MPHAYFQSPVSEPAHLSSHVPLHSLDTGAPNGQHGTKGRME